MANVIRQNVYKDLTYTEYMHKCGEIVNMLTNGPVLMGWADISKVRITTCPHCLELITLEEVQLPSNVEQFGWP